MCAELETWRYETMIALVNLPVVSKTNRWDSLPVCSISAFACSSYKKYSPAACRRYVSYVSYKREAAVLWAVRGRKGFTNWSLSLPLKVLSTSIPLFFQLGACFPNYIFTFLHFSLAFLTAAQHSGEVPTWTKIYSVNHLIELWIIIFFFFWYITGK